jgi:hypothetical protein
MTTRRGVELLATFTNRDDAGRHFTERYADDDVAALEADGLIEINRPVHEPTGISYDRQYWTAEVTQLGIAIVEQNPAYHPSGAE